MDMLEYNHGSKQLLHFIHKFNTIEDDIYERRKNMIIFWVVVLALAVLLEIATFALISIWFAAGSVVALIAAALNAPVWLQFVLFIVVSAIMLIFTRPLLKKLFPDKFVPTNSELYIGKSAVVIEDIDTERGMGRVKLNGVDWIAVNDDGKVIPKDALVTVTEVRGAKLAVKPQN